LDGLLHLNRFDDRCDFFFFFRSRGHGEDYNMLIMLPALWTAA
jgi:hypothetical protein